MKNLIFAVLFLFSFSSLAAISIVSDLDDTIKITQSDGDLTDYVGDTVFTGIPEFFKGTKDYSNELHILSASPSVIRAKIKHVLKKRGITYQNLVLRNRLSEDKFDYKVRSLKKIMDASSDDFIFLGDDLGKDPEAYAEIKRLYPNRVLEIYIHIINGRKLVEGVTPYWTSFDLFIKEFDEGRMSPGWLEMGWRKMMEEKSFNLIFPKKAQCPTAVTVWEWQLRTLFQAEARELMNRMTSICQLRQSVKILP